VSQRFIVRFTEDAAADLRRVTDKRSQGAILRRAQQLDVEPLAQGKALTDDLKGFRSVRAAGQRYRVIYQVGVLEGVVTVVVIGIRKEGDKRDAYRVARRRLG
jgi:mRNA interferase RelE/StbE